MSKNQPIRAFSKEEIDLETLSEILIEKITLKNKEQMSQSSIDDIQKNISDLDMRVIFTYTQNEDSRGYLQIFDEDEDIAIALTPLDCLSVIKNLDFTWR